MMDVCIALISSTEDDAEADWRYTGRHLITYRMRPLQVGLARVETIRMNRRRRAGA